jgi:hypothetical protein
MPQSSTLPSSERSACSLVGTCPITSLCRNGPRTRLQRQYEKQRWLPRRRHCLRREAWHQVHPPSLEDPPSSRKVEPRRLSSLHLVAAASLAAPTRLVGLGSRTSTASWPTASRLNRARSRALGRKRRARKRKLARRKAEAQALRKLDHSDATAETASAHPKVSTSLGLQASASNAKMMRRRPAVQWTGRCPRRAQSNVQYLLNQLMRPIAVSLWYLMREISSSAALS